jgi:hypothetical protein
MQTELHFDQDLFSIESIAPATGITLQHIANATGEALTLTSPAFSFAKDDVLATLTLKPFVSDRTSSDISLSGLVLNDNDANFTRCIMSPSTTLSTSTASVTLDCFERTLQRTMDGTMPIIIRAIYPQPASSQDPVVIELESLHSDLVEISIRDLIGREVHRSTHASFAGIVKIMLSPLPAGYNHLVVRSDGEILSRGLIVR